MNRIVIIGNGFDLAHGLKTSYSDFLLWYKKDYVNQLIENHEKVYDDTLCRSQLRHQCEFSEIIKHYSIENLDDLCRYSDKVKVSKSLFFQKIEYAYETKLWLDIEEEYYQLLKQIIFKGILSEKDVQIFQLNNQLEVFTQKLVEYLKVVGTKLKPIDVIMRKIQSPIVRDKEVQITSIKKLGIEKEIYPQRIMLLNFNFTLTADVYIVENNMDCLNIHGRLYKDDSIIFGYGDEIYDDYKKIAECHNNEYLRHFKSNKYLEDDIYRNVLRFVEQDVYQILIMGHSCGNSDRTLLNTLFNHPNCVSIKPYYYVNNAGKNNFSDLIINISRNFNETAKMRDVVVNKKYCETLL